MIGIVAALPREVAVLVRGVNADKALLSRGISLYRLERAVVVAAGMGASRVTVALQAALAAGPVKMLVSTGLAGACSAELKAGDVAEARLVVDTRTGERFATADRGVVLATSDAIASVADKARLAASYGAAMVDMEAATVARLAVAYRVGVRVIKGISDAHDFELESLKQFATERGEFRTGAFALHTALRPGTWGKAMELGRGSSRALAGLAETLRVVIEES
ncbi:MAG: phosphorylase [Acidobacteriota bacterium]